MSALLAAGVATVARAEGEAGTLAKVHVINQAEIAIGKIAQDKGTTGAVRDFGAMLVKDHTAADAKVTALAGKKGFALSDDASRAQADKLAGVEKKLKGLDGAEFDKTFGAEMANGHADAIAMVRKEHDATKDQDVKGLLGDLLPALETHENMAKKIEAAAAH
jgi:putative membrane protein